MTEGAATPPEETVARRLEGWRRRLLDLSRSNRLVHYRIRAASSVQVVREDAAHVADLVLAGKRLGFDPKPDDGSFEQAPETRGGDLRLQTPLDRERLERVLVRLFREARARLEEQGFHTLHLAFGMLEYETTEDDRPHRAPLLLVPVELERRGALGAPEAEDTGLIYVVLGGITGTMSVEDAPRALVGEARDDEAGYALDSVGDLDGDGVGDLLVGAPGYDDRTSREGAAYLIPGGRY